MSVLKWQDNSSSDFVSFFIFMIHNSSVGFKLILFLRWIKASHHYPKTETLNCSGENLLYSSWCFPNHKSVFLQILYPSSVSWKITSLYFFSSNNIYFARKEHIKMKIFENFKCSGQNSSNCLSILKWQVNSSSNFASFFTVMTHNFSVDFKLILFLLWITGSHQYANFETLNCSGENLLYSSCHFPNHKSVFLQILHHPSVSWKITPLHFLRSNIKYFAHFSLQ